MYVCDLETGTIALASCNQAGAGGNDISDCVSISGDGRLVCFDSGASDLTSDPTAESWQVFVRDLDAQVTTLVSRRLEGSPRGGNRDSWSPVIAAARRLAAFQSMATDLTAERPGPGWQVFLHDLETATTELLNPGSDGASWGPLLSADGRLMVFSSDAPDDTDDSPYAQVCARDLATGAPAGSAAIARAAPATTNRLRRRFRLTGGGSCSRPMRPTSRWIPARPTSSGSKSSSARVSRSSCGTSTRR